MRKIRSFSIFLIFLGCSSIDAATSSSHISQNGVFHQVIPLFDSPLNAQSDQQRFASILSPNIIPASTRAPPPASSSPIPGVDFHGPLWLPRSYKVTCCRGGEPKPENEKLITNWTQTVSDYAIDERGVVPAEGCRVFEGDFLLAAYALFNLNTYTGYGVKCKCPEDPNTPVDAHCRPLPSCLHGGRRSLSFGGRCLCPDPYFGELCEKFCEQGQKLKGMDGREYCSCVPFYQGEECRDMLCLNGGMESNRKCSCPPTFLGYHCEIDTNRTVSSRFQRYGENTGNELFSRDISGTVFSMIMIIVLVISMYLLMKHRMQVQYQQQTVRARRDPLGVLFGGNPRRAVNESQPGAREPLSTMHFVAMGIEGPPPYMAAAPQRASRLREANLPPLPSYEDATKIPPLRPSLLETPRNGRSRLTRPRTIHEAMEQQREQRTSTSREQTEEREGDQENRDGVIGEQPSSDQNQSNGSSNHSNENAHEEIDHPLSDSYFNRSNHMRRSI
ncbi:unnamed protein product, partial [Mesorhabditis belari]|uniref:EGF-like domain-containing protein n=1 Tax=Mesorhabditis belari TaxID=2138241 RepID=A0AAF3J3H0_9BILA